MIFAKLKINNLIKTVPAFYSMICGMPRYSGILKTIC